MKAQLDELNEVLRTGFDVHGSITETDREYYSNLRQTVKKRIQNEKRRVARREYKDAMESIGLKRVRGALGGTYWE